MGAAMQILEFSRHEKVLLKNRHLSPFTISALRRCISQVLRLLLFFTLILTLQESFAAPFCVVTASGTNCWYFDAKSCQDAANNARGMCVINEKEQKAPSGNAPFCVVTGMGTSCWYYDANTCRQAASNSGGTCIPNPKQQ